MSDGDGARSVPTTMLALRGRWLFPVDRPPVAGGVLSIAGERIAAVGENLSGQPPLDLGDVAILPGLVNAHTHLEFSDLAAPLGRPGMSLPEWIRAVLAARETQGDPPAAIRRGLAESLAAGTTALGEIVTTAWPQPARPMPHVTLFRELIGLSPERIAALMSAARHHLALWPAGGEISGGLSPHAPYTVHPDLLRQAVAIAREHDCPLAMHLAESREELELLSSGAGPFAELLRERGVWQPGLFGGRRIVESLEILSGAPRSLVIHGNYLAAEDIALLAAAAERMTVVYCPRTHAYFGHEPYPLARLLAAGVPVALGTDSSASNPDLSLLAEIRAAAKCHPSVALEKILEAGTLIGARALGLDRSVGTLTPGKLANLSIVPVAAGPAQDPHEALLAPDGPAAQTWIRGSRIC